ncbi:carbohydrate esterase family 15 protein [Hypoxylon sp. FL1857]|nr:carbohydrate esterase family 15 protein [Hypoxylon sp. FL1857]
MPFPKCAAIIGAVALPWLGGAIPAAPAPAPAVAPAAECAPVPAAGKYPTWQQLPKQTTLPDPWLPLAYTTTDSEGGSSPSFASDVMAGKGKNRIQTPEEWYRCRQPEILQMLQEYQYGYYPDHSKETVKATRSGNTVNIEVTAGGKTGKFSATLALPSTKPAPVVINIGGMTNQPYLQAGIAVVGFDYTKVAPDSNAKTGAFWDIYNGQDIGVLTAWAWGFHRVLDALNATVPEIDPTRVGVTGCSRLGKAALAAGLLDTRITLTMPMSSGVQGLGPYRYHGLSGQDETLENSKSGAGWWTDKTLGTFVNHAENLPYDAHTIAAAIAPRALVIDQGTGDQFTNSKGTSVIVYPAAKLVYDWLGVPDQIAMSVRGGGHCDMSGFNSVLPFVTKVLQNQTITKDYNDLGSYGSPMTTAYPWATAVPKAA